MAIFNRYVKLSEGRFYGFLWIIPPWPSPRLCFQSQVDGPRSQFQATHPARAAHAAMFLRSSVQVPVAPEIGWMLILEDQNDPS